MKTGRHVYNTLSKLVRRVIQIVHTYRQGLLIAISVLAGGLCEFAGINFLNKNQSLSSPVNILSVALDVLGIVILAAFIGLLIRQINKIDKKEEAKLEAKDAERETKFNTKLDNTTKEIKTEINAIIKSIQEDGEKTRAKLDTLIEIISKGKSNESKKE